MRLVNYGPGEITDRLTILALKILYGRKAGKPVAHFETEKAALLAQIRSRTLNGKWFDAVVELAAINGALWRSEDALRQLRKDLQPGGARDGNGWGEAAIIAFGIQELNDDRAALVHRINQEAGEAAGQEKV